jgi:hypothetical protein
MTIGLISYLLLPYVLVPLLIWSMTWKGLALWAAGKRKEKAWFIVLFLINTVGILEIIYLLTRKPKAQPRPARRKR